MEKCSPNQEKIFSTRLILLRSCLALLLAGPELIMAQPAAPVIASLARNGELVCTNLEPGTAAAVEWAPAVTGPWTNMMSDPQPITVAANGSFRASVPMSGAACRFYRVSGRPLNPNPTNLVWLNPGTFTMGSPDSEPARESSEGPQTRVTITHGFWIGKYEVTQGEYLAVMGHNPSYFTNLDWYGKPIPPDLSRPVEQVSWDDAVAYCSAITLQDRNAGRLPSGYVYRLPTEAEWEYACRAATTTAFHYGDALRSGMANFPGCYEYPPCGNSTEMCLNTGGVILGRTTSVGSYAPNAWGLYDMHGNVREWCHDWFGWAGLPGGSVTDPPGAATGWFRVIRGGSWGYPAIVCRSAFRNATDPTMWDTDIGFRVVLAHAQP